jgi:O-antigen/teichoic acid export membrane protein
MSADTLQAEKADLRWRRDGGESGTALATRALAVGAGWLTASYAGRLLVQAGTFILVARALGAGGFGTFSAGIALVAAAFPLSGLGQGEVMILRAARDPAVLSVYCARALGAVVATAPALSLAVLGAGWLLVPSAPVRMLLLLCVSELVFARIANVAAQTCQVRGAMASMAVLLFSPIALRALAAVVLFALPEASVELWALFYALSSAAAAVGAAVATRRYVMTPSSLALPTGEEIKTGLLFALGLSANSLFADVDKPLVARLDSVAAAGAYTSGYRVVAFAFAPVLALLTTTYPTLFRMGASGLSSTWALARRVLWSGSLYSAMAGLALYFLAPAVPAILGREFDEAVSTVRLLAVLPFLQTLSYVPADMLAGSGRLAVRTSILGASVGLNVGLCVLLIPAVGTVGAAVATLAASGFLVVSLWLAVALFLRRDDRGR